MEGAPLFTHLIFMSVTNDFSFMAVDWVSHLKHSARKKLMQDFERQLMPLADGLTHEELLGA